MNIGQPKPCFGSSEDCGIKGRFCHKILKVLHFTLLLQKIKYHMVLNLGVSHSLDVRGYTLWQWGGGGGQNFTGNSVRVCKQIEQTADWEVQVWRRWQDPPNCMKSCVRGHNESRCKGRNWSGHEPGQSQWMEAASQWSPAREDDFQRARQMSQSRKWSGLWPSGRGENRRDSQEPTGGLAHRKGKQNHSRWHSRWGRNMDMGRWARHHLRRRKEEEMGGRVVRRARHQQGVGPVWQAGWNLLILSDCRCCS